MRRGISPIVAVVLLISIAVVAAVGLYFWAGGITTKQNTVETPIAISAHAIDPANGVILVANLGESALTLSSLLTTAGTECVFDGTVTIEPNEQAQCTMPPIVGEVTLYNPDTGQAVVILPATSISEVTFQVEGFSTSSWSQTTETDFDAGTYTNTSHGSDQVQLAGGTKTFTDTFSTTDYKDPSTNADWEGNGNVTLEYKSIFDSISSYSGSGSGNGVVAVGDLIYLASSNGGGLYILNASDPRSIVLIRRVTTDIGYYSGDVYVDGNYAYVSAQLDSDLFSIVNITNPASASVLSTYAVDAYRSKVVGNTAYVGGADGVFLLDVSDKLNPTQLGNYSATGCESIDISGDYAYIDCSGGFRVLNVSDSANPNVVGSYSIVAKDILVEGDIAYLGTSDGISLLNVSNFSDITEISSYATGYSTADLDKQDDIVWTGTTTVSDPQPFAINVSDVNSPTLYASMSSGQKWCAGIDVDENYYYCGEGGGGIVQISAAFNGYMFDSEALSTTVDSTPTTITSATLSDTVTTPAGTSLSYYLSADNGLNWEAVTSGVEHTFANTGSELRWKAEMVTNSHSSTPVIDELAIQYLSPYYDVGNYLSSVFNTTYAPANFTGISWSASEPANTALTAKVHFSNTSDFSSYNEETASNGTAPGNTSQFVRYLLEFTGNTTATSVLYGITLDYKSYNGNLTYTVNTDTELTWVALNQTCDGTEVTLVNDTGLSGVFYTNTVTNRTDCSYEVIAPNIDVSGTGHLYG